MSVEDELKAEVELLLAALGPAHSKWVTDRRKVTSSDDTVRRVATYVVCRAMANAFALTNLPVPVAPDLLQCVDDYADAIELKMKPIEEEPENKRYMS